MDIISSSGSIRRGIIISKYREFFQLTCCHSGYVWHKVIGYAIGVITQKSAFMGTDWVKIAQEHSTEIRHRRAVIA